LNYEAMTIFPKAMLDKRGAVAAEFAIAFMPIGVILTLPDNLWLTIIGVGVITIGFFGGHSIASSWVGLRADMGKAQASALYRYGRSVSTV